MSTICGGSLLGEHTGTPPVGSGAIPTPSLQSLKDVREISLQEMRSLVELFHYLGKKRFRASYCFGLYVNNILVGGIAFHGISAPETAVGAFGLQRTEQSGLWEIGRLVLRPESNGKNLGSFLIAVAIKLLKKKTSVRAIITYAESPRHNGGVYRASNFIYCGLSNPKKDFYVNGVKQERGKTKGVIGGEWRQRPRKHRFVMVFDSTLKLRWIAITKIAIGTKVSISSKDSWANKQWGTVTGFDGENYHVAIYGGLESQLIFKPSEINRMST